MLNVGKNLIKIMTSHELLKRYIQGVVRGYSNSLMVVSPAGLGKTEMTLNALTEMGLTEGINYCYFSNYLTPLSCFLALEEINYLQEPKLAIFDDFEDSLSNPRIVGLLKGALWSLPNGQRKVMWNSGTYRIKQKEFNFTGRIIFLLNKFNRKSPLMNALADRSLFYEMKLTKSDMIGLMSERIKNEFKDIPYQQKLKVIDLISKMKDEKVSLRVLPQALNLCRLSPNHYTELISKLL